VCKKQYTGFISKYGDGEYNCVNSIDKHNCDKDKYTDKLKTCLIESFKSIINDTENAFIGLWPDKEKQFFWEALITKQLKWVDYHSVIFRNEDFLNNNRTLNDKIEFYKNIKESSAKK